MGLLRNLPRSLVRTDRDTVILYLRQGALSQIHTHTSERLRWMPPQSRQWLEISRQLLPLPCLPQSKIEQQWRHCFS